MKKRHGQDSFQTTLRKSGFKATPTRLAILEVFRKSKRPLSAQAIIEALPHADQVTVYRTFKSLAQKGIIHQIDLRHNHAHYELIDIAEHHHLICLACGRIEDVRHCNVDEIQSAVLRASKHFSEVRQHTLEFYGICKACGRKNDGHARNTADRQQE
jgi:Fur family ferric uptake transcriptional regulator